MTSAPDGAVEHHIERLDRAALSAFVGDLWAARGYEVGRDDSCIHATKGGHTVTIYPVGRRRLGSVGSPSVAVDLVVAPAAARRGKRLATDLDARVVDAEDLHGMLRHAVDAGTARQLCREHLGAEPDALPPPLRVRFAESVRRVERAVPTTALLGLLLVTVLVVTAGIVQPTLGGGASTAPTGTTDGGSDPEVEPGTSAVETAEGVDLTAPDAGGRGLPGGASDDTTVLGPPNASALASVPGLGVDGVTNITVLADAQAPALANESYTLWLDRFEPDDDPNGSDRVQFDTDVAVDGDRYRIEENRETDRSRERLRTTYYDGTAWYVATYTDGEPVVERIERDDEPYPLFSPPRNLSRNLVLQFLNTPETNVTAVVRQDGERRFRLEGRTLPPGRGVERIRDYRIVAYVGQDGLVHDAEATFSVVTSEGTYRVRFQWTYGQFGVTSVREPSWASGANEAPTTAVAADNRTASAGW